MKFSEICKRIYPFFKPHFKRFILAVMCMLGFAAMTALSRWLIKLLLDEALISKRISMVYFVVVALPIVFLFYGIFWFFKLYLLKYISQNIAKEIRNKCFEHLQFLSLDYYHRSSTGKTMTILTECISSLEGAIANIPIHIISDTATVIGLFIVLVYLNWKLAIISLFVLPFCMVLIVNFSKKLKSIADKTIDQTQWVYHQLEEKLSTPLIIKLFNRERYEIENFSKITKTLYDSLMRFVKVWAVSSPIMEFFTILGISILILYGSMEVIEGKWTAGSLVTFIVTLFSFYQPLKGIANLNPTIQMAKSASEKIFKLLDEKITMQEPPNLKRIESFKNEIVFENVSFNYPGTNELVLKNLNFKIKMGQTTAIIGPSGAGKTSLIYLLMKFFQPVEGKILWDDIDIAKISSESIRNLIGIVPQDIFLFNDTIYANITYGDNARKFDDVVEAAKIANAHDFIMKLPQGYDTIVGERGVKLSGGQKQRISIARAILKKPQILIFDEATSAVDSESEQLIQDAIEKLMKFTTLIIITHRLSTIKNADKIIVIDNGEVIEEGSHKELFQMDGLYRKFHKLQFY